MIAYKFLSRGAVGPFTKFAWPTPAGAKPGPWVDARGSHLGDGVHACSDRHLPYWLGDELWKIELAGDVREHATQVEAQRARLLARVERWNANLASSFSIWCAFRVRDLAVEALAAKGLDGAAARFESCATLDAVRSLSSSPEVVASPIAAELAAYFDDAAVFNARHDAPCTAFISAVAAVCATGRQEAFDEERAVQARWLAERLGVVGLPV